MILGTKIFVDVTKHDIDECVYRIVKELVNVQRDIGFTNDQADFETEANELTGSPAEDASLNESSLSSNESPPINWTEERVDQWAQAIHLNKSIQRKVLPCNGKLLYQYYSIHKSVPEFFYSTICKAPDEDLSLKELAIFAMELCNLFDQQK